MNLWAAFGLGLVLGVLLPRVIAALENVLHDADAPEYVRTRQKRWWQE